MVHILCFKGPYFKGHLEFFYSYLHNPFPKFSFKSNEINMKVSENFIISTRNDRNFLALQFFSESRTLKTISKSENVINFLREI